ncbi:sensor histidine kinase [Actinoplanes sp. LDG1-06]|uniref:Sensor histidine kinase n=1 Tax=Paractinoplanes ovalisporus TaxID=2810368 RepID=A0ABS2AHW7_9ACTN|nr:sensor histidine kinase [Actinoplanes ovalisporus]MBM2619398.1 sensor histidine kinase [Actinoplanes ovalisporus]
MIIDSDDTLDRLLVPVLRGHAARGEPVLIVVSPATESVLRARLGSDAEALTWGDSSAFYQRLGFAYEAFRRFLRQQHAEGRSVHVIAEPDIPTDLDAPIDRVAAYLSYESICNDTYAEYNCPVTCLWDSRRHPTLVIEGVRSIHDHELTDRGVQANNTFVPAHAYLSGRSQVTMPPAPPATDVDLTLSALTELEPARTVVTDWATGHGFSARATGQITVAVNEVVTNGLQHGLPPVRLRAWHHDGILVVQVDDRGARPIAPDAGYRSPAQASTGTGLWLARQFADIVLTQTDPGRTAVRLYFPHALTHRNLDDPAAA